MRFAFGCRRSARSGARGDGRRERLDVLTGLPQDHAFSGVTEVGAIEAKPNDGSHLLGVVFAEACIGAGGAARVTRDALRGTPQQHIVRQLRGPWVEGEDLVELSGHL
ncbi:MAG TPA: hypothetical protein VGI77_10160 [Gaiellaceae bacterium]